MNTTEVNIRIPENISEIKYIEPIKQKDRANINDERYIKVNINLFLSKSIPTNFFVP